MAWTIDREKTILLLTIFSALAGSAAGSHAQDLTAGEIRAVSQSGEWQRDSGVVTRGAEGKVIFLFGQSQPSVICAPLQVCDIELEPQETVRDVLLGDSVRWNVEAASSGEGREQRIHLIVRPTEPGLQTSMIVTTSRRTYHVRLASHESRYMARIGFSYPNSGPADLATVNERLEGTVGPASVARLDFAYRITGRAGWRPKRVYSDGAKTYIQFPASVSGQELPVLFLVADGQRQMVNYRVSKNVMIVDYQVDRAILVSGSGWRQKKITIKRGG